MKWYSVRILFLLLIFLLGARCSDESPSSPPLYTVTFQVNGGREISTQNIKKGDLSTTPNSLPSREGFIFKGWYKDESLIIKFKFNREKINSDTTIYARWELETYTVNFKTNGGTVLSPLTVSFGKVIGEMEDPVKKTFDFKGWYKDLSFIFPFNVKVDKVLENLTLYAKWEISVYKVEFVTFGGSQTPSQNVILGQLAKRPIDEPKKPNVEFINWYADEKLEHLFNFKLQVITEPEKIYAKWASQVFYVTLETNGAGTLENKKVPSDEPLIEAEIPEIRKLGYTFGGWHTDKSLLVRYTFGVRNLKNDITLYAKWLSEDKEITSFKFEVSKNTKLSSDIYGIITGNSITVKVTSGTDITSLIPTITFGGSKVYFVNGSARSNPNNTPQDFSSSMSYVVIAQDGTSVSYTINVYNPSAKDLIRFLITREDNAGLTHEIIIQNPSLYFIVNISDTDSSSLIPRVSHTGVEYSMKDALGNILDLGSQVDFSNPITFRIRARDGTHKDYIVVAKSVSSKDVISFDFLQTNNNTLTEDINGKIIGQKINILIPNNVNLSSLKPFIFHNGESITPLGAVDFTQPVIYTLTAKDSTSKTYTVEVQGQLQAKQILSFDLKSQNNISLQEDIEGVITFNNGVYHIYLDIPFCSDINKASLTPTIRYSGGSISPDNLISQDFSSPITYRVAALDNSVETYQVSIRSTQVYQDMNIPEVNNILQRVGVSPSKINYVHVLENAPRGSCGSDWNHAISGDALAGFLKGINDAYLSNFYVILVGKGYFYPGKDRISSFGLKNNVALIGGWDGTNKYKLDPKVYRTLFSGGISEDFEKRSYHTFKNISLNSTAILYGATITGGYATGNREEGKGGGVYNEYASPSLINVDISSNYSVDRGAGMFNAIGSSPRLFNVTFHRNISTNWGGGGMYNSKGSNPLLTNVTFNGNKAKFEGGGMYNEKGSSPTLINVTFSGNKAHDGGGVYFTESSGKILNCTFTNNRGVKGGGVYAVNSDLLIVNCILWGNIGEQIIGEGSSNKIIISHTINQSKINDDPNLSDLANNGGYVNTIAIDTGSSAVNTGLYIKKYGEKLFFSQDNALWYNSPQLKISITPPPKDSENITKTDARGFLVTDRPDIGAFEFKNSN